MSIFRSEEMGLYTIDIGKDYAEEVMEELGKLSCLHFIDVNDKEQIYRRAYTETIRRCDEASRRIKYVEGICNKYHQELKHPQSVEAFLDSVSKQIAKKGKHSMAYFDEIEATLKSGEEYLIEQEKEAEKWNANKVDLDQRRYVLNTVAEIVLPRAL